MKCIICQKETEKTCSSCKSVGYCCVEHQKLDWPNHKKCCQCPTSHTPKQHPQEPHAVFFNNVVWRNVSVYLNFADLKEARLVCRIFNVKIVTETNFKQRAVVQLTRAELKPQIFGLTKELWSNFNIVVYATQDTEQKQQQQDDHDNFEWFYPLLKSANSIQVNYDATSSSSFSSFDTEGIEDHHVPSLDRILGAPEKLQNFGIGATLLGMCFNNNENDTSSSSKCLLSEAARQTLDGLKEFQVILNSSEINDYGPNICNFNMRKEVINKLADAVKNLRVVTVSDITLKSRRLGCVQQTAFVQKKLEPFLIQIITNNLSSLTKIQCDYLTLQSMFKKDGIKRFPSLVSLLIYNIKEKEKDETTNNNNNLVEFLKQQPFLDELDLTTALAPLSNEVWSVIRDRSVNFKRLRIKMAKFAQPEEVNMFTFLRNLEHLNNFELDISTFFYSNNANVGPLGDILLSLPGTLQKISINGVPYFNPNDHLRSRFFQNLNPNLLTVLSLKRYECAITDDTLECVFTNFKMLQVFEISESYRCTDYGFTGIGGESDTPNFSVKDLKGLKSLMIRDCVNITNKTCDAIAFLELTKLDISRNDGIDVNGINTVLENNPSLEYLKISRILLHGEELLVARPPRFRLLDFPARNDRDSQLSLDEADLEENLDALF